MNPFLSKYLSFIDSFNDFKKSYQLIKDNEKLIDDSFSSALASFETAMENYSSFLERSELEIETAPPKEGTTLFQNLLSFDQVQLVKLNEIQEELQSVFEEKLVELNLISIEDRYTYELNNGELLVNDCIQPKEVHRDFLELYRHIAKREMRQDMSFKKE
ncbi:MAG: hypothetical protein AAFN93_25725 [Bacteroidota bacterium]